MTREELFSYVKEEYAQEPDYPFENDFETAVIRHSDTGKWFALVMYVRADKLGYESISPLSVVTVKSDPMLIDTLIQQPGFHRAYHMNKLKWLTIELERVNESEIKNLIDMSYELTDRKLPKSIRYQ